MQVNESTTTKNFADEPIFCKAQITATRIIPAKTERLFRPHPHKYVTCIYLVGPR